MNDIDLTEQAFRQGYKLAENRSKEIIEQLKRDNEDLKNELCYRCGYYRRSHLGACNGCKWKD